MDLDEWDRVGLDDPSKRSRSFDEYLSHASALLKTGIPLIVFTQAKILPHLLAIRPGRCAPAFGSQVSVADDSDSAQIEYRIVDFDRLPLFPWWSHLRKTFVNDYRSKGRVNDSKDTPGYLILMNSKWDFVNLVSSENPFSTSHVGWVDIGLAHCNPEVSLLRCITSAPHPRELTICMEFPGASPPPLDEIPRRWWGRIMFGLWTIPRELVEQHWRVCTTEFRKLAENSYYPFENEVLYWILNTKADSLPPPCVYQASYTEMIAHYPLSVTAGRS